MFGLAMALHLQTLLLRAKNIALMFKWFKVFLLAYPQILMKLNSEFFFMQSVTSVQIPFPFVNAT